jgi:hypothetical protein
MKLIKHILSIIAVLILFSFGIAAFLKTKKQAEQPRPNQADWREGEFVMYRKQLPHQSCAGFLVFNGQSKPAPYSETERFYTHVCDKCSATNSILNTTWPQVKREWRDK